MSGGGLTRDRRDVTDLVMAACVLDQGLAVVTAAAAVPLVPPGPRAIEPGWVGPYGVELEARLLAAVGRLLPAARGTGWPR